MNRICKLLEVGHNLGTDSEYFITRDLGRKAFRFFEQELEKTPVGDTLIIDSQGVVLMDGSFFDETVLNLVENLVTENKYGQRYLLLTNVSEDSLTNLDGAISRRKLKVAVPVKNEEVWRFIGALEPNLDEAAKLLMSEKELTARAVADRFKIGISSASNRLRRLNELRLAKRIEESTETGMSHRYFLIA